MKKIVLCPHCSQKIRMPAVFNKRLRIRCQSCQKEFDLMIKSPLLDLFMPNSNESFFMRLKKLPLKPKMFLVTLLFLLIWGIWGLFEFALQKSSF